MPVEIRELVIRATVSPEEGEEREAADERSGQRRGDSPARALSSVELERVVNLCVGRVLRSMKRSQER
jgi:hypothetical protein